MKYVNQLTDEELTEIYKSFMGSDDKFVDLEIRRYEDEIMLEGHIKIPEEDEEYADEDGYCEIDEDYSLKDYHAGAFHHSGNVDDTYRRWMYKKFGKEYAEDYLFNH